MNMYRMQPLEQNETSVHPVRMLWTWLRDTIYSAADEFVFLMGSVHAFEHGGPM